LDWCTNHRNPERGNPIGETKQETKSIVLQLFCDDVVIREVHIHGVSYKNLEEIAKYLDINDPVEVIPRCIYAIYKTISKKTRGQS
jgi:hypothetical protein